MAQSVNFINNNILSKLELDRAKSDVCLIPKAASSFDNAVGLNGLRFCYITLYGFEWIKMGNWALVALH